MNTLLLKKGLFLVFIIWGTPFDYSAFCNLAYHKCYLSSFRQQSDSVQQYLSPHFRGLQIGNELVTPDPFYSIRKDSINDISKYSLLKKRTSSNFFTRQLFSFLINEGNDAKNLLEVKSSLYFELFAGKTIASIRFKQLDVFGPTLQDTTLVAKSWASKLANSIHLKTVEKKLRKQLLFTVGQKVQPEVMADNEKVFRDLPYIRDVAIILTPTSYSTEEIDVLIIVKERFEYGFVVDAALPETKVQIYDDNMFGVGHQFSAKLINHTYENPKWGGELTYSFSDFGGKFINGGVGVMNTFKKSGWNMFLEKKFISSEIIGAGGLSYQRIKRDNFLTPYNLVRLDTAVSYLYTDGWYGHTFINKNKYSKVGNTTLSGRYLHHKFYSNFRLSDYSRIRNHDFILTTLGFSKRNLFKNNLVYGYGITEDIPYGRYFELASGVDFSKTGNRFYSHFLFSKANIMEGGSYISSTMGIGGFIRNSNLEQGALKINLNYFSRLIFLNKTPYRNFINIELLSGIDRYRDEYIGINRYYGLRDFKSLDVKGTSRLKINMESVHFLNWNYHGFRFAQYFFGDCAFLSDNFKNLLRDDFYTGLGIGLRVHNESLVFRVFELRLTWFPVVPNDQNILKFKIFTQSKGRFDDFLGRKPEEIGFQ